ncbi:MAG: DUF4177 domain-containing protein [Vicinamibacterales bacterium]
MDQWEYTTIKMDTTGFLGGLVDLPALEASMNELGSQGWELVTAFDTNQSHGASREVIAIFKRRRR